MQGSHAVDASTTIEESTPGAVAIAEAVRMARMHPDGPKRLKITLGGWSDYARLCTVANAEKVAALMGTLVQVTFADGVDLDFEHLTPFDSFPGCDEFGAFSALIRQLRKELDRVGAQWKASARTRGAALAKQLAALPAWQRSKAVFYNTSIHYLQEVEANPVPHLEISWTTRFNAWVPKDDPFNYLANGSAKPNATFETDNEGSRFYPAVAELVDTINVMAYDAGGILFDYPTLLDNFRSVGKVDLRKLNMGFEPGEQAASGVWEGLEKDTEVAGYVKHHGAGGCMIWAVNPSPKTNPTGTKLCPETAQALSPILQPTYAWGPAPKYTPVDPKTGYLPEMVEESAE
jgi:hypothetical protein